MPLFRWKKTRRYEVSSRNSYVVCVHLLDTSLIECTLTADSCGLECLENIAQRIELNQCEYFGLRYVNKKLQFRWIELDKPLKKQLDKNAHSPLLYFGVMFYVPDAQSIQDDMTRYQYYLQLKSDIIDGKLPCSSDKAVLLAAYSVQAELGDFDYERHTVDNLKEIVLLPRNMTMDDRSLADLTQDIINNHQTLVRWSAATAEVEYILEAQQLEGYGMEYYSAKDHSGRDVLLGAYYAGVFVKVPDKPAEHYKWSEVSHFTYSKKHFAIVSPLKDKPVQFTMDDPDSAKYIYKLFSLQMSFFTGRIANTTALDHTVGSRTPDLMDSHIETNTSATIGLESLGTASPGSQVEASPTAHYDPSSVQDDPSITILNTPSAIATTSDAIYYSNGHIYPMAQGEGQQQIQQQPTTPLQSQMSKSPQYISTSPVPLASNSYINATPVPPSYRHTPDYETVMRQRMEQISQVRQQRAFQHQPQISTAVDPQLAYLPSIINNQVCSHLDTMSYSQPEIHHMHLAQASQMGQYQFNTDLSMGNGSAVFAGGMDNGIISPSHHYPLRPVDRTSSLIIYPTYASPDTNKSSLSNHAQFSTSERLLNELAYKPPPPYARSSNSTPDLASQTRRPLVNSSPDLISRHHLHNNGLMMQSMLDQSMENLAIDANKLSLTQRSAAQSKQNLEDASSLQSEMQQYYLQPAGSIPDVAHNAMLTQDYAGVGPVTYTPIVASPTSNTTQRVVTPTAGIGGGHGTRDSCRSLPHPQNYDLVTQATPDYAYTGPIAFDNPAFRDNLPMYLREVQAYQNNEMAQAAAAQHVTNHIVTSQPTVCTAPPVADPQTTVVVMRKKKAESVGAPDSTADKPIIDKLDEEEEAKDAKRLSIGALKMAALNGLTLSRGSVLDDDITDSSPEDAPRVPKDERRRQLEAKLQAGQVFVEFEKVDKKRLKSECTASSQPMNRERNRFKDVLPYDDNRVKLTPTKENPMGYINASNIKVYIGESELLYVAAQGPLQNTVHDFWQMVWEQEIEVIAMLTKLQEHGKPKCHRYWPENIGLKHKVQHAQYQVVMKFSNNAGPYTTSGLVVKHLPSNRERLVWHLQYTDWPDHGCPDDIYGFLSFLDEVEAVKRQTQMQKTDSRKVPLLVHCSAGVGRTGVVLLTESIKACLEHNQDVDVPGMLSRLREQRMYTVQTVSQYSFVYTTLVQYLKGSRLI